MTSKKILIQMFPDFGASGLWCNGGDCYFEPFENKKELEQLNIANELEKWQRYFDNNAIYSEPNSKTIDWDKFNKWGLEIYSELIKHIDLTKYEVIYLKSFEEEQYFNKKK